MGNMDSYGYDPTKQSKLILTQPQYQVYESQSGEQYQKYIVNHNGNQPFQQSYSFRINEKHDNLVDILYIGQAQSLITCRNKDKYQVITQRIPYRLNSLTSINFKNSLVILKSSLRAFGDLYKKYGAFGIKEKMIGINKKNKVKVWLNQNFALNNLEQVPLTFADLSPKYQQRQMMQGIFDLINSKTETSQLWAQLMYLKQANNPSSFDQSLSIVMNFSGQRQLNINENISNIFRYKFSTNKTSNRPNSQSLEQVRRPQPLSQYNNKQVFPNVLVQPNIFPHFQQLQRVQNQVETNYPYRFPIVKSKQIPLATNIRMNYVNVSEAFNRQQISFENRSLLKQQPEASSKMHYVQVIKSDQAVKGIIQQNRIKLKSEKYINLENQEKQNEKEAEKESEPAPKFYDTLQIQQNNEQRPQQNNKLQQQSQQYSQNLTNREQSDLNSNQLHSEQQQHIEKQPSFQQNNNLQTIKPSFQKISLSSMQLNQRLSLQNIKTSINVSLVDTRQIKRKSIEFQQQSNEQIFKSKSKALSYREMRKILLQQLQS